MNKYCFQIYKDKIGKYRFRLVASNGRIMLDSGESFKTKGNAKRSAERLKRVVTKATIKEL